MRPRALLAGVAALIGGCAARSAPVAEGPSAPWRVAYSDGSANAYRFWRAAEGEARFEYSPVTPAESSTGTYSGGEPKAGPIPAKHLAALWRSLRRIEGDRAIRIADRIKGSGAFRIEDAAGVRKLIVDDSPALRELNEALADLRRATPP